MTLVSFQSGLLIAVVLLIIVPYRASAACFDPAVEAGLAFKDEAAETLLVIQQRPSVGGHAGDTIAGIAVRGKFFGCSAGAVAVNSAAKKAKTLSLFLKTVPSKETSIQGFEVALSSVSRRILSARAIQVSWDVVDRSNGVTAICGASSMTAFESFLYGALRQAKSRRCTVPEIEALVKKPRR